MPPLFFSLNIVIGILLILILLIVYYIQELQKVAQECLDAYEKYSNIKDELLQLIANIEEQKSCSE